MLPVERPNEVVIERRSQPTVRRGSVTGLAVGWETRLRMVGIGRLVEVGSMAIHTGGWRSGVPSVGMAQSTVGGPVLSVERPSEIVIERGPQPTVRRSPVTGLAVGWETSLRMVGIGRLVEVGAMTIHTGGWRSGVPSVGMAQSTVGGPVLSVERPSEIVIERRSQPTIRRSSVTGLAVGWETRLRMVGIGRLVEVGSMAIHTGGWRSGVPSVGMAQSAVGGTVLTVERPSQIVIERRPQPIVRRSSVTGLAVGWETRLRMVGVRRPVEVGSMAIHTICRCACVSAVGMTLGTVGDPMLPVERKHAGVVEICTSPALSRRTVAGLTVG